MIVLVLAVLLLATSQHAIAQSPPPPAPPPPPTPPPPPEPCSPYLHLVKYKPGKTLNPGCTSTVDPSCTTTVAQFSALRQYGWEVPATRAPVTNPRGPRGEDFYSVLCDGTGLEYCVFSWLRNQSDTSSVLYGGCGNWGSCATNRVAVGSRFIGIGETRLSYKCFGSKFVVWVLVYTLDWGAIVADFNSTEAWRLHVNNELMVYYEGNGKCKVESRTDIQAAPLRCNGAWLVQDGSVPAGVIFKLTLERRLSIIQMWLQWNGRPAASVKRGICFPNPCAG